MFAKRGRVYLEMQAHVHLRVWGGLIVPKKCRISSISQPGDPSRNFYNLNFELYLEHHLEHLQQLSDPLGAEGTYHFFFLALQIIGRGLDY